MPSAVKIVFPLGRFDLYLLIPLIPLDNDGPLTDVRLINYKKLNLAIDIVNVNVVKVITITI